MDDLLAEIVAHKRNELNQVRKRRSLSDLKGLVDEKSSPYDFYKYLKDLSGVGVIAACKQKLFDNTPPTQDYDPVGLALNSQRFGAAALAVLTDEKYFGGTTEHLRIVSSEVALPVMRTDFIVDEYQIYESRYYGASSYLLIADILDTAELQYFIEIGRDLGMEPLVESRSISGLIQALGTDAKIIGINSWNFHPTTQNVNHILNLKEAVYDVLPNAVIVCERDLSDAGSVDALLKGGISTFTTDSRSMVNKQRTKAPLDLKTFS